MSVIIHGLNMPKYTTKAEFGIDADGNPLCMVYHEDGTEPDIYDVVPLPEGHGRLIDADELMDRARGCLDELTILSLEFLVNGSSTIVPAEGGGEDGDK